MKARSILIAGAAVVALGALVTYGLRPDPVPVDLAEVTRGHMQITIDADGKTRIKDVYEVASPIAGQAQRSPVEVGDAVVEGETVVAIVEPIQPALLDERSRIQAEAAVAEAEAALQVARAQLRQAEEDLSYAQSQYERTATLVDRGVVSFTQLESATQIRAIKEASLDAARSTLSMTEGSLNRARASLIEPDPENLTPGGESCCIVLHAPTGGVVLGIDQISKRPVAAGARLLTIGQPDNLEIVADLLSSDAVRIVPGTRAIVERWGGPASLDARLKKVEPSAYTKVSALGIEEQRVDVVFDLMSTRAERQGLGDGFSVFLRIVEWEAEAVLQVPVSALFRDNGDWFVFTVSDGVAQRSPVEIGRRNGRMAEVKGGLAEGAQVVTHPNDRVTDGAEIVDRKSLT